MGFFSRIRIFFLNFISQKIDGYICTNEEDAREICTNSGVIDKYNVAAIKFEIPFLDSENHWVSCYFIPKQAQEDLYFLSKLKRNMPVTGIFKKRKLEGFAKDDYDLIELWSSDAYKEIRDEMYLEAQEADALLTKSEEERALKAAQKHAEKLAKREAAKEAKRQEREAAKAAKLEEKKLEKEAKKLGISVSELKKRKGDEGKEESTDAAE